MRLLHTSTYELKEFISSDIPEYAILSHTWEEEEILFEDIHNPASRKVATRKRGWRKVVGTCERAKEDGLDWVWIDTCCINKDSSAELSEAINSMFRYYRNSFVCYAYLSDYHVHVNGFPGKEDAETTAFDSLSGYHPHVDSCPVLKDGNAAFAKCRWFTRGWTLQELIAPSEMVFFDAEWNNLGTKYNLRWLINQVTGIPHHTVLIDGGNLKRYSIATRMSWAADRQTTREEDQAYSLMGIFGVNIPTLYGEGGERAFMRLQEEIIKYSDDQSIFAWMSNTKEETRRGLLARSPSEFKKSHVGFSLRPSRAPYSLTNHGLHIHLPMQSYPGSDFGNAQFYYAYLDCGLGDPAAGWAFGPVICLRKMVQGSDNLYERCEPQSFSIRSWPPSREEEVVVKEIYVPQESNFQHLAYNGIKFDFGRKDPRPPSVATTSTSMPYIPKGPDQSRIQIQPMVFSWVLCICFIACGCGYCVIRISKYRKSSSD
ncbi:hypothetical protein D9758_006431 [Tetrapyrgos nigripes]|uniref:HET-domain-containing protein n=1 Tax=Tetrapyrgos nigripes TaxID=182062 RepID=A0A8H5DA89_9AGAR|nr:hypothetical protein D9758_006431 [Tetrapyrgos nigripes]